MSAPTRDELADLAGECSAAEWRALLVHGPFLAAATRSIEETREVAKKFLGRNPAAGLVKQSTKDSDL